MTAFCAISAPIKSTDNQAVGRTQSWTHPGHLVLVIEENKSYSTIIGNRDAPYINGLAKEGMLFTDAHAVMHPSLPNYVALFSGSTYGLTDDSCPHDFSGPNLASELIARKLSFAIYSEDLPETGFSGCSGSGGLYRRKHNPVVNWQSAGLPASLNRPFSDFPQDYSKLPSVAFVVPNMLNDMHDGTIAQGDAWLKAHLSRYTEWAKSHNSLLIITWDESDAYSASNQIPLIITGAGIKPGRNHQYIDHYGVLRTIEDLFGLKPLGQSASASPIRNRVMQSSADKKLNR
ncbi:MAG: alkaline phosphatase family protein [Gammaproteobacteria bacterium]